MFTINAPQLSELQANIDAINTEIETSNQKLTQRFLNTSIPADIFCQSGQKAYALLQEQIYASGTGNDPYFHQLLYQWQGINKAKLLSEWWQRDKNNHARLELVTACSGFHPVQQKQEWENWVNNITQTEIDGYNQFIACINENPLAYDLAFILSCQDLLKDDLQKNWWPVIQKIRAENLPQQTIPQILVEVIGIQKTKADIEHDSARENAFFEDDIESIHAPEKPLSTEDKVVAQHSTWHIYFKPFLTETWTGLIGISLLMAAWLFLSMWVWDKGEYYRILADTIPLALFTAGAGWITHFFYQLKNRHISQQVLQLFATLCVLSIPFNFFIVSSLLTGSKLSFITGSFFICGYLWILPKLARWLEGAFDYRPSRYLILSNSAILIPGMASFLELNIQMLINFYLYTGLAFLLLNMNFIKAIPNLNQRFNLIIWPVHYLFVAMITYIYFQAEPEPIAISILLQIMAIGLSVLFKSHIYLIITAAGLSLTGNLLVLEHSAWLPLNLILSTVLWFRLSKNITEHWPIEIIAVHLIALISAGAIQLGISALWAQILVIFSLHALEKSLPNVEIKTLSYGIPVFMLLLSFTISPSQSLAMNVTTLAFMFMTGIYGYFRYSHQYNLRL